MGIISKLLSVSSCLEETFMKEGENVTFSDKLRKFLVFILGVGQQHTRLDLLTSRDTYQNFSKTIKKKVLSPLI